MLDKGIFVTGTDTGIGKTWICLGLITAIKQRGYSVIGMKPVASGSAETQVGLRNQDALALAEISSLDLAYQQINPYCFAPPIAPHVAAQQAGTEIQIPRIVSAYTALAQQADRIVVEGVGGWRVPLSATRSIADLARALKVPVLLVVGLRLGCINHALLTAETICADGLSLCGWVANNMGMDYQYAAATVATLKAAIPAPLLAEVPYVSPFCAHKVAHAFVDTDLELCN